MNIVLALDNITSQQLEHLAPHKSMFDLNVPRKLTSNARIPKPVASTIANWLHDESIMNGNSNKSDFLKSISV